MFAANAGAGAVDKLYVDDVFSTYTYTGNGGTQSIVNGINLSTYGGMVWQKLRDTSSVGNGNNQIYDTVRGTSKILFTDAADASSSYGSSGVTAFNSNGFTVTGTTGYQVNENGYRHVAWTFRKAQKFFDIVTWTGDGTSARVIPHNLGITPGMIFVKCTSTANHWAVYHRYIGTGMVCYLNSGSGMSLSSYHFPTVMEPTSSAFCVGNASDTNQNGYTYIAYIFAHDTTSDGIIQCGSFNTDGSGNSTAVNLGWEPQYLLTKRVDATENWEVMDVNRGFDLTTNDKVLYPNSITLESSSSRGNPTSTGFENTGKAAWATYIYMAIRRSNKPPTDATKVFKPTSSTGQYSVVTITDIGFPPDLLISKARNNTQGANFCDRLRGTTQMLDPTSTSAESTETSDKIEFLGMSTISFGYTGFSKVNYPGWAFNHQVFKRAASFFDIVCYTGTSSLRTVNHNLGVIPELIIFKTRSPDRNWFVYYGDASYYLTLYSSANRTSTSIFNYTAPTASNFTLASSYDINGSGETHVAYLFATCKGVSKVGTYTGTGTTNNIDCGFTAGARFLMIKDFSGTGDWYYFDTNNSGITAGIDAYLAMNRTEGQNFSGDLNCIDPYAAGFTLNSSYYPYLNTSGHSYMYLAIA